MALNTSATNVNERLEVENEIEFMDSEDQNSPTTSEEVCFSIDPMTTKEEIIPAMPAEEIISTQIPLIEEKIKKKDRNLKFNLVGNHDLDNDKIPSFESGQDQVLPILTLLDKMKTNAKKNQKQDHQRKAKRRHTKSFFNDWKIQEYITSTRKNLYYFLERPVGMIGIFYRLFTFSLIIGSILTGCLTTLKSLEWWTEPLLYWYEVFATIFFTVEFFLLVWSSSMTLNSFLKFLCRPLIIVEVTVILTTIILLIIGIDVPEENIWLPKFTPDALLLIRFFQILRLLYVDRHGQTWKLVYKTVKKHKFELITSVYIALVLVLFSSYLILIVEKDYSNKNNGMFENYADALYWSIITMTTIGYGDKSPQTFYGKIITNTLCIFGIGFWTLPGGVIGSGFALKVEQKNKKKQFNRLLPAAASYIQAWWRMKATLYLSSSNPTCMLATIDTFDISNPIHSSNLRRLQKEYIRNMADMNEYFTGIDAPTIHRSESERLIAEKKAEKPLRREGSEHSLKSNKSGKRQLKQFTPINTYYNTTMSSYSPSVFNPDELSSKYSKILIQLSPEHLILIRTILTLKFMAAKTRFKLAYKPYDFKDVIEQYSQGNMDILVKMKDLQKKIDQIASFIPQNSPHYNNIDLETFNFPPAITLTRPTGHVVHNINDEKKEGALQKKRSVSLSEMKSSSTTNISNLENKENEIQIVDRVKQIEINLESLANKLDILINASIKKSDF